MTLNINKAIGLGLAVLTITAGSALAASTSGHLTVYASPNDSAAVVGTINGAQTFSIVKRSGDWCKITSPQAGWVACSQLSDAPRTNFSNGPSLGGGSAMDIPIYNGHNDGEQATYANP